MSWTSKAKTHPEPPVSPAPPSRMSPHLPGQMGEPSPGGYHGPAPKGDIVAQVKDVEAPLEPHKDLQAPGTPPAPPPAVVAPTQDEPDETYVRVTYWEIFKQFFIMGWIGFGGPAAHIGLFQKTFVERLKWMSPQVFMELFSLGQCLPGPTSTQVSFAMGTVKKGVLGGLLSGIMFQYPGAVIMTVVGAGAANFLTDPEPWLEGLVAGVSAVGVALVASAAKGLLMKMCGPTDRSKSPYLLPDLPCAAVGSLCCKPETGKDGEDPAKVEEVRRKRLLDNFLNTQWANINAILATLAAGAAIYWSEPWLFPLAIIIGFIITNFTERHLDLTLKSSDGGVESLGFGVVGGAVLIGGWLAVLILVLVLARTSFEDKDKPLNWFEAFYRTGSIIYGGGQVVLPMLYEDVVKTGPDGKELPNTWVTDKQFYAGLGAVQAMPGPLFNFSTYLGCITALKFNYPFILGAVLAWFGLFSPGVMLMFGALPYWKRFRTWQIYRRGLPGMNAVGIGLILASVFKMTVDVYRISPFPSASLCIALFAFTAVDELKIFEPFVVIGGGLLGLLAWGADMR